MISPPLVVREGSGILLLASLLVKDVDRRNVEFWNCC
jgi:hypothetical protein